jgi:hypothetical protein
MKSIAVAMILSVALVPTVFAQETRTLTANEADQGLSSLSVEGNVGKMQILASTSGGIRVRVDVKQADSGRRRGNPEGVDLRTSRNGSTLVISLSGDVRDLEETWSLEIPAYLRVQANFGVGDIDVRGVQGGIKAKIGVGSVKIDVPEGNIEVESGVGQISAKSATNSYGNIDVRGNVGNASVRIDGQEIRQQNRPPGPGEHITYSGRGRDQIQIRSGVGNAELTIGR